MVLVTECFPTHRDHLLSYFEKFKNGELRAEDMIDNSKSPTESYIQKKTVRYIENSSDDDDDDNDFDIKFTEIKQITKHEEGAKKENDKKDNTNSLKNFKKFIIRTNKHLDQIMENQKKIDFVHEIVGKIREPLNEFDQCKIAEIIKDSKMSADSTNHDILGSSDESDQEDEEHNEDKINKVEEEEEKSILTLEEFSDQISTEKSIKSKTDTNNFLTQLKSSSITRIQQNSEKRKNLKINKINNDNYKTISSKYSRSNLTCSSKSISQTSEDFSVYSLSSTSDKTLSSSLKEPNCKPVELTKIDVALEFPNSKNTKLTGLKVLSTGRMEKKLYQKNLIVSKTTLNSSKSARVTSTNTKHLVEDHSKDFHSARASIDYSIKSATFKSTFEPRSRNNLQLKVRDRSPPSTKNNAIKVTSSNTSTLNVYTNLNSSNVKFNITPLSLYTKLYNQKTPNISPLGIKHTFQKDKMLYKGSTLAIQSQYA